MKKDEKIRKEDAKKQVLAMAQRCAMIFQAFSEVLVEEIGEEKGKDLIQRAITLYGNRCGEKVKEKVRQKGYSLTAKNYDKVLDVPTLGWEGKKIKDLQNEWERISEVTFCPLAEYWINEDFASIGRMYCYVDQAKFTSYNQELECVHLENVLDGDKRCLIAVRKKKALEIDESNP